jgi:hypothetical protein
MYLRVCIGIYTQEIDMDTVKYFHFAYLRPHPVAGASLQKSRWDSYPHKMNSMKTNQAPNFERLSA